MDMPTTKDPRVPYDQLERAVREARAQFPHAHKIKAMLSNGRVAVEVWPTRDRGHVRVPAWAQ